MKETSQLYASLESLKNNSNLKLSEYERKTVEEFIDWIINKPEWYVLVTRKDSEKPLIYGRGWRFFRVYSRFDKQYVKRINRRFRILEYISEKSHFVHIVFTVKHEGSRIECCKKLSICWNSFRSFLIKRIGEFKFVRVLEAHRDGYPHMHILLFTKKYVIKQKELSEWCKNHGLGKIVFIKRYWAGRYYKRLPILYLSKYLTKQYKKDEWDDKDLIFYSILWKHKVRSYNFSHSLVNTKIKKTVLWVKYAISDLNGVKKIIEVNVKMGLWSLTGLDRWFEELGDG